MRFNVMDLDRASPYTGRAYTTELMEEALRDPTLNILIKNRLLCGELREGGQVVPVIAVTPHNVAYIIKELMIFRIDGLNYLSMDIEILDTPKGKELSSILASAKPFRFVLCGYGTVTEDNKVISYKIGTVHCIYTHTDQRMALEG